jgi:hypothetical protein
VAIWEGPHDPAVERAVWEALMEVSSLGSDAADWSHQGPQMGRQAQLKEDLGLSSLQVLEAAGVLSGRLLPDSPSDIPITDVRSVEDLCSVFQKALASSTRAGQGDPPVDDELMGSVRRAGQRRTRRGRGG